MALITDIRLSVEEQIFQMKSACKDKQQPTVMSVETEVANDSQRNKENLKVMTSIQCPTVIDDTEDDLMSMYNQFVDGNLKILASINKRDSIQIK